MIEIEQGNQSDKGPDVSKTNGNTESHKDNAQLQPIEQPQQVEISTNQTENTENVPKKRGRKRKIVDGKER